MSTNPPIRPNNQTQTIRMAFSVELVRRCRSPFPSWCQSTWRIQLTWVSSMSVCPTRSHWVQHQQQQQHTQLVNLHWAVRWTLEYPGDIRSVPGKHRSNNARIRSVTLQCSNGVRWFGPDMSASYVHIGPGLIVAIGNKASTSHKTIEPNVVGNSISTHLQ